MAKIKGTNLFLLNMLNNLGFLNRVSMHPIVWCGSTPMRVPIINGLGYYNLFDREQWLGTIMGKLLPGKHGAFLDVGANLGQTLLKLISVEKDRPYFGFEPNFSCCSYVQQLIRLNNLLWHQIFPVGLSNTNQVAKLYLNGQADVNASLLEGFRPNSFYASSRYVPVFEGDFLLSSIGVPSIAIIKIDVEGMELEVIQGLRNTIDTQQPYIICEILPVWDAETERGKFRKSRIDVLESTIGDHGYSIFRILHDEGLIELKKLETVPDLRQCEYLLVPNADKAKIVQIFGKCEKTIPK